MLRGMRWVCAAGMVVFTMAAVFGALMIALVFLIGPLPGELPGAALMKIVFFGVPTLLFVAAAVFCGRLARRKPKGRDVAAGKS